MRDMRDMKIKTMLIAGFGSIIISVAVLCGLIFSSFHKINVAEEDMMLDQYPSIRSLLDIKISSSEIYNQLTNHILDKDDSENKDAEEVIKEQTDIIDKILKEYELNVSTDEERKYFDEFEVNWNKYKVGFSEVIYYSNLNEDDKAYAVLEELYNSTFSLAEKALNENIDLNDKYLNDGFSEISKLMKNTLVSISVFSAIGILFGLICSVVITKNIMNSTNSILNFVDKAASGDLTEELTITSRNELGLIGEKINVLVRSLRQIIGEVSNVTDNIASSSEELTATAEETSLIAEESAGTLNKLAQGASDQLNSVKSANESIDAISQNIKDVANRSEKVTESSKKVLKVTHDGRNQSDNAMSKINEIEEITKQTSKAIETLNNESEKIGNIVAVIKDISDQTNLLSLNAAIEAARAGEQGKGFAVVAEEVRDLAEQSSKSAQEIEDLIRNIQVETKKAVEIAAQGSIKVEHGVEAVNVASQSFTTILNEISDVDNQIKEVYGLADKTLKVSEGVVDAMNHINDIAEKSAYDTDAVSAGAQEQAVSMESVVKLSETLSQMGNTLQELISRFKI